MRACVRVSWCVVTLSGGEPLHGGDLALGPFLTSPAGALFSQGRYFCVDPCSPHQLGALFSRGRYFYVGLHFDEI